MTSNSQPRKMSYPSYAEVMEKAGSLPLYDAAYVLWSKRIGMNAEDGTSKPFTHPPFWTSHMNRFRHYLRQAHMSLTEEKQNARTRGGTYNRMRRLHRSANAHEIGMAIGAAIKLEEYSCEHSWDDRDLGLTWEVVMERLRAANPGFLEQTYRQAYSDGAFMMR